MSSSLNNTTSNFSKTNQARNPSKQELREHISEIRFDLDQLQFAFQGHKNDTTGKLNSHENLIRSQQRLFDDMKKQISQLRAENTQLQKTLIDQFYQFQAEFTATKHDVFLNELSQMREQIANCQASVKNIASGLEKQELNTKEVAEALK